jgi:hypothetical protein
MEKEQAANPEVGIGDLFKWLQVLEEAVLSGQTEIPVQRLKIAGRHIDIGPTPVKVTS